MNKQIINAAIKQSGHYADILNGILYVSKSFQTNANYYGTTEYRKMNEILAVYPDMKIELYVATRKKRLTYEMMEAFIRIMPDAEKNFATYTRVRKMSVAYKSPYKFVEDWFAKQFPYYGELFVEEKDENGKKTGKLMWNAVEVYQKAKEQAEAKKNEGAAKAVETNIKKEEDAAKKNETAAKPTETAIEQEVGDAA